MSVILGVLFLVSLLIPTSTFAPKLAQTENLDIIVIQGNSVLGYHSPVLERKTKFIGQNLSSLILPEGSLGKIIAEIAEKILICESGKNHYNPDGTIKKGKSGEIGIAQFLLSTWVSFNQLRGTNLDIENEEHQIDMLYWALENNLGYHWTCYKGEY